MVAELVPGGIRVQAIFQGKSGLPTDRYVNTFHFADIEGGPTVEADLTAAAEKVDAFYSDVTSVGGNIIGYLDRDSLDRPTCHLRAYDLSQPEPREPLMLNMSTIPGGSSQGLPTEVAACLSFYSLVNAPSSRGRVYLGPLGTNAVLSGSAPAAVSTDLRMTAAAAALALRLAPGPIWSILTHPGGGGPVLKTVTNGWIDDAFDTQRRRGQAPVLRNVF